MLSARNLQKRVALFRGGALIDHSGCIVGNEPRNPLPAVCDVSVTNVCNAACDFCGFSRDKKLAGPRRYLEPDEFARALPILRRRRIRYMTLQGGRASGSPEDRIARGLGHESRHPVRPDHERLVPPTPHQATGGGWPEASPDINR